MAVFQGNFIYQNEQLPDFTGFHRGHSLPAPAWASTKKTEARLIANRGDDSFKNTQWPGRQEKGQIENTEQGESFNPNNADNHMK